MVARAIIATAALAALTACTTIEETVDQAGRSSAKTILPEALATYFPQVPKALFTPFTDCIIDNAQAAEVRALAADAVLGVDAETAATIRTILSRPETAQCLTAAAPNALAAF